jgi:eukaryotic-like serine/threonine-protein kinase
VSPDGRWFAYASNETGRYEVWLEPLPQTGERHRVTRNGGSRPLWSADGAALFFDRDPRLFTVDVTVEEQVSIGEEAPLPIAGFEQGELRRQYDLMPDGSRFLLLFALD